MSRRGSGVGAAEMLAEWRARLHGADAEEAKKHAVVIEGELERCRLPELSCVGARVHQLRGTVS